MSLPAEQEADQLALAGGEVVGEETQVEDLRRGGGTDRDRDRPVQRVERVRFDHGPRAGDRANSGTSGQVGVGRICGRRDAGAREHSAGDIEDDAGRREVGEGQVGWDELGKPRPGSGGRRAHVEVGVEDQDARRRRRTERFSERRGAPPRHSRERRRQLVEQVAVLLGEWRVIGGSHQVQASP